MIRDKENWQHYIIGKNQFVCSADNSVYWSNPVLVYLAGTDRSVTVPEESAQVFTGSCPKFPSYFAPPESVGERVKTLKGGRTCSAPNLTQVLLHSKTDGDVVTSQPLTSSPSLPNMAQSVHPLCSEPDYDSRLPISWEVRIPDSNLQRDISREWKRILNKYAMLSSVTTILGCAVVSTAAGCFSCTQLSTSLSSPLLCVLTGPVTAGGIYVTVVLPAYLLTTNCIARIRAHRAIPAVVFRHTFRLPTPTPSLAQEELTDYQVNNLPPSLTCSGQAHNLSKPVFVSGSNDPVSRAFAASMAANRVNYVEGRPFRRTDIIPNERLTAEQRMRRDVLLKAFSLWQSVHEKTERQET